MTILKSSDPNPQFTNVRGLIHISGYHLSAKYSFAHSKTFESSEKIWESSHHL